MESSSKSDINTFFGRCRCCLEQGYMKNLWSEYYYEGNCEIYGEMIMETFTITWEPEDDMKFFICESCVIRLRDAYYFKKEVIASEKLLSEEFGDLEDGAIKFEVLEDLDEDGDESVREDEDLENSPKRNESEMEYCEVEYLDDEIIEKEDMPTTMSNVTNSDQPKSDEPDPDESQSDEPKKRTWPRKKKRGETTRSYKNYSEEDMKSCLEAVREKEMSISEASQFYGIPKKTLCAKIHNPQKKETPANIQKVHTQERQTLFVKEIQQALFYINAVPFKVREAKYYCAYCSEKFDDPDELRIHCREHEEDRLNKIENILRPHSLNEILRVDIQALHCTHCESSIKTWNDMFQHLKDIHEVELDQCYTKLVPFKLRKEFMHCALCDEKFANFALLDNHMNTHYCNYICSDCGDTFLTETRLKHHIETHNTGRYPCEECGKVFSLEKYMKKHAAIVHKKCKMFKCLYCPERYHAEYERHNHVIEKHNEKVRISTCEICGKTFDWRPYYLAHLRKVHSNEKKNKCRYCSKAFKSNYELKMHEQRHTGSGKHVCSLCNKNYVTMMELKLHFKKHFKEVGFLT